MKRNARKTWILVLCLLLAVSLTACGGTPSPSPSASTAADSGTAATESASSDASQTAAAEVSATLDAAVPPTKDPYEKYDPPIEVTLVHTGNDGPFWFPEGDDINNNIYTRKYEEVLGIKYRFLWTCPGSQAEEKVNIMMASGDLPDLMSVNRTNFEKLYKAGQLADITVPMQEYASQYTKKYMTGEYASLLDAAVKDGRIYGEASGASYKESANMLWIRADWLKKLGLSEPKTMADLEKILDAFVNGDPDGNGQKDTYAIGVAGANMAGNSANFGLNAAFFNMFHSYPGQWVKNGAGELEQGMFGAGYRDGTKAALGKLAEWYAKGYLNQDFALMDDAKLQEDMTSGKFGLVFQDLWGAYWPLLLTLDKDPNSDWVPVGIPSADDKPAMNNNTVGSVYWINVANKNFAHPEALVKMTNLYHDLNNNPEAATEWTTYNTNPVDNNQIFICYPLQIWNPAFNYEGYVSISDAIANGTTDKLPACYKALSDQIADFLKTGNKGGWPPYRSYTKDGCFGVIDTITKEKRFLFNEYSAEPTEFMIENWPSVKKQYDEFFITAIMNGDLSGYDAFVAQYDSLYGQQATKEVNDWFAANGKNSVQDWYLNMK